MSSLYDLAERATYALIIAAVFVLAWAYEPAEEDR